MIFVWIKNLCINYVAFLCAKTNTIDFFYFTSNIAFCTKKWEQKRNRWCEEKMKTKKINKMYYKTKVENIIERRKMITHTHLFHKQKERKEEMQKLTTFDWEKTAKSIKKTISIGSAKLEIWIIRRRKGKYIQIYGQYANLHISLPFDRQDRHKKMLQKYINKTNLYYNCMWNSKVTLDSRKA